MTDPAAPGALTTRTIRRALIVLTLINLFNYLDRYVVAALVETLKLPHDASQTMVPVASASGGTTDACVAAAAGAPPAPRPAGEQRGLCLSDAQTGALSTGLILVYALTSWFVGSRGNRR